MLPGENPSSLPQKDQQLTSAERERIVQPGFAAGQAAKLGGLDRETEQSHQQSGPEFGCSLFPKGSDPICAGVKYVNPSCV